LIVPSENDDGVIGYSVNRVAGVRNSDSVAQGGGVHGFAFAHRRQQGAFRFRTSADSRDAINQFGKQSFALLGMKLEGNGLLGQQGTNSQVRIHCSLTVAKKSDPRKPTL
jgi:hypothetical protein